MHKLLEEIFITYKYKKANGEEVRIHSETGKEQCEFLQKILRDNNFTNSLEIGFAFGLSTLAIVEEVSRKGGKHIVIDKYEVSDWGSVGLDLIREAGFERNIEFHENFCYEVLPKLKEQGVKVDFAYIDSTKQFDWLLVDFFYIDKILKVNGIIVFDDVTFPGIRKLLRYISQFPSYQVYETYPSNYYNSYKEKLFSFLSKLPLLKKLLKESILQSDFKLGINTHCVALRKMEEDKRNWDWHKSF